MNVNEDTDLNQKAKVKKETPPPPSPKPKATSTPTPKKKKDTTVFRHLPKDKNPPVPIDVAFEGNSAVSKLDSSGEYSHNVRLNAPGSFSLIKTVSMH